MPRSKGLRVGKQGVMLSLFRDLGWKYAESSGPKWEEMWGASGPYDFFQVREFTDLRQHLRQGFEPDAADGLSRAWEEERLCLFEVDGYWPCEEGELLAKPPGDPAAPLFCVFTELNLSWLLLQHERGALHVLKLAADDLLKELTDFKVGVLGSLSRPDLILYCALNEGLQLNALLSKLRDIRSWTLSRECFSGLHVPGDGHCFLRVKPLIGMNHIKAGGSDSRPAEDSQRAVVSLWTNVAHEEATSSQLAPHFGKHAPKSWVAKWGAPNLAADCPAVIPAARAMREVLDNRRWRRRDVIEAHYYPSFTCASDGERSDCKGNVWQLAEPLRTQVTAALRSLRKFARDSEIVVGARRERFLHALRAFEAGLYRLEICGLTLDLVPFVLQCERALTSEDLKTYLTDPRSPGSPGTLSERQVLFAEGFDELVTTLMNGVRNRQEHHLEHGGPPAATTFFEGTCKSLDAASVAAWLTWERLLRRTPDASASGAELHPAYEDAASYAILVSVGQGVMVEGHEILAGYRHASEWSDNGPLHKRPVEGNWTAPLIHLKIPRLFMVCPDVIVPTMLHEIAEITDFPAPDRGRSGKPRRIFNEFVLSYAADVVSNALMDWSAKEQPSGAEVFASPEWRNSVRAFAQDFVRFATIYCPILKSEYEYGIDQEFERRLLGTHPEALAESVLMQLSETVMLGESTLAAYERMSQRRIDLGLKGMWAPLPHGVTGRAADFHALLRQRIQAALKTFPTLLMEIVADTAMIATTLEGMGQVDRENSLRVVNMIYGRFSEFLVAGGAKPDHMEVDRSPAREELLMLRWALQVGAMARVDPEEICAFMKPPEGLRVYLGFPSLLQNMLNLPAVFGRRKDDPSLMRSLGELKAYGGSVPFGFPSLPAEWTHIDLGMQVSEPSFQKQVQLIWNLWEIHFWYVTRNLLEPAAGPA